MISSKDDYGYEEKKKKKKSVNLCVDTVVF